MKTLTKNLKPFHFEYKIDTSGYQYNVNGENMQFSDVPTEILTCWIDARLRHEAREELVDRLKSLGISSCCIWIKEVA